MIAVLLVAWTHAGQPLARSGLSLPHFGIFGVDIFFVISGFILSLIVLRSTHTPGIRPSIDFVRRRAIRIFPVYWLFALYPIAHHFRVHDGPLYLPAFFLLPGHQYPDLPSLANFSWTLIFEMFFYLLFGMVLLFTSRRRAVKIIVALLVALVAAGTAINIQRPVLIVAMNPMLLEFAMGALAALVYSRQSPRRWTGSYIAAFGVGCALVLRTLPQEASFQWDILTNHGAMMRACTWGFAAACIVFGTVLASPAMQSAAGKLAVLLGNASYSTYLLSGFLLLRFSGQISHLAPLVHGRTTLALLQASLTALLMALGLAFYLGIEKRLLGAANRFVPALPAPRKQHTASLVEV